MLIETYLKKNWSEVELSFFFKTECSSMTEEEKIISTLASFTQS